MSITHGPFTGDLPITLSQSGLPAGVTFTDNGDATYSLDGTWPSPAGEYPYSVTATNAAGSITVTNNKLITTPAGPPVEMTFGIGGNCAVTTVGCASFSVIFQPDGTVEYGTNEVAQYDVGTWHDGSINPADYQVAVTYSGGRPANSPPQGVWQGMGSGAGFTWSICSSGETSVSPIFEIRRVSDNVVVASHSPGCQQIGVGVVCNFC